MGNRELWGTGRLWEDAWVMGGVMTDRKRVIGSGRGVKQD